MMAGGVTEGLATLRGTTCPPPAVAQVPGFESRGNMAPQGYFLHARTVTAPAPALLDGQFNLTAGVSLFPPSVSLLEPPGCMHAATSGTEMDGAKDALAAAAGYAAAASTPAGGIEEVDDTEGAGEGGGGFADVGADGRWGEGQSAAHGRQAERQREGEGSATGLDGGLGGGAEEELEEEEDAIPPPSDLLRELLAGVQGRNRVGLGNPLEKGWSRCVVLRLSTPPSLHSRT